MSKETGVIAYGIGDSACGRTLAAISDRGVCAVILGDDEDDDARMIEELQSAFPMRALRRDDEACANALSVITQANPDLPVDMEGTDFQREVWHAIQTIGVGQTRSYAEIARQIGRPASVRAVAQACASNRVAVLIPCHRVVRSDGGLSGYRWGVERKKRLLQMEASV